MKIHYFLRTMMALIAGLCISFGARGGEVETATVDGLTYVLQTDVQGGTKPTYACFTGVDVNPGNTVRIPAQIPTEWGNLPVRYITEWNCSSSVDTLILEDGVVGVGINASVNLGTIRHLYLGRPIDVSASWSTTQPFANATLVSVGYGASIYTVDERYNFKTSNLQNLYIAESNHDIKFTKESIASNCGQFNKLKNVFLGTQVVYGQTSNSYAFTSFANALETLIIGSGVREFPANTFVTSNLTGCSLKNICVTSVYSYFNLSFNEDAGYPAYLSPVGYDMYYGAATNVDFLDMASTPSKMKKLTSLELYSDTRTELGKYAFSGCHSLTSLKIPASAAYNKLATISYSAFAGCRNLKTLEIPWSVNTIGHAAFFGCENIQTIKIEDCTGKLTFEWELEFSDLQQLSQLYIGRNIAYAQTSPFRMKGTYTCPVNVTLSDLVTEIPNGMFESCLVSKISFGEGITRIGDEAFSHVGVYSPVTLPNSLEYIGRLAFDNFNGDPDITSITIPENVSYIGYGAFNNMSPLVEVKCRAQEPPSAAGAFSQTTLGKATLHVPDTSLELYREAKTWQDFSNIVDDLAPMIDPELKFTADEVSLLLDHFSAEKLPVLVNEHGVKVTYSSSSPAVATVNASTGVVTPKGYGTTVITAKSLATDTSIASSASYSLTLTKRQLKDPKISFDPDEIEVTLGEEFEQPVFSCESDGKLIVENMNPSIAYWDEATGKLVVRAAGSAYIMVTVEATDEYYALFASLIVRVRPSSTVDPDPDPTPDPDPDPTPDPDPDPDPDIDLGVNPIRMSEGDFQYILDPVERTAQVYGAVSASTLVNAVVPEIVRYKTVPFIVTSIMYSSFQQMPVLQTFKLPATVRHIGSAAFRDSKSLREINLEKVAEIEYHAFYGCSALTYVKLSDDLKLLESSAFRDTGLKSVDLGGGIEELEYSAFYNVPLVSLDIPESLRKIGRGTFTDCTQITSIRLHGLVPPETDYSFSPAIYNQCELIVAEEAIDAYKAAPEWGKFYTITADPNVGVAGIDADSLFSVNGGELTFADSFSGDVLVSTVSGIVRYNGVARTLSLAPGCYLLRVGGRTFKIII